MLQKKTILYTYVAEPRVGHCPIDFKAATTKLRIKPWVNVVRSM